MYANELVEKVAEKTGLTKKIAKQAMNAVFSSASDALVNEGKLTIIGFGTFSVKSREAREGRNPQTGAKIHIDASKTAGFKPGRELKGRLN